MCIRDRYDIIKIKNIEINLTNSKVYKDDKEIELKALEYKILVMLFEKMCIRDSLKE